MPWPTRARSWTDPSQGATDADLQAKMAVRPFRNYSLQNIRGALVGQNQLGAATQQALGSIAQIMHQRKQDQIAQTLLNEKAQSDPLAQKIIAMKLPPTTAWQTYQQQQQEGQQGEDIRLTHELKQAQLNKLNAPDTMVDTPYGKMEPYQWAQISNKGTNPRDELAQDMFKKYGVTPDQVLGQPATSVDKQGAVWTETSKGEPYVQITTKDGRSVTAPRAEMAGYLNRAATFSPETLNSQFGVPAQANVPQRTSAPAAAIDYLRAHPESSPDFDQKYGAGSASSILAQ